MRFLVITHVPHIYHDHHYCAYAPYVREMNLWFDAVAEVVVVAPKFKGVPNLIHEKYNKDIKFVDVPSFRFTSILQMLRSFFVMPFVFFKILLAMRNADHIHLRCPGNMGLLGCLAQVFYPSKTKTAKYAGNWDWDSKQPFSYRLQQRILSNTFLTKRMQTLVYGDFDKENPNIKPFFTATYANSEREQLPPRPLSQTIKFVFVGTLSPGKRPDYVLDVVLNLRAKGMDCRLDFYGDGAMRSVLQEKIVSNNAQDFITLHGNKDRASVLNSYKTSHFLMLPSKSEGWPKVVAEAMFWACVPVATRVSCVPYMLDNGHRGVLLDEDIERDVQTLYKIVQNPLRYEQMAVASRDWSQKFTLDLFAQEIKHLLVNEDSSTY